MAFEPKNPHYRDFIKQVLKAQPFSVGSGEVATPQRERAPASAVGRLLTDHVVARKDRSALGHTSTWVLAIDWLCDSRSDQSWKRYRILFAPVCCC